jgi:hypothetical protein
MLRRAARAVSGTSPEARGGRRALTPLQVGPDLDQDVWDRVVGLWRDAVGQQHGRAEPEAAAGLHEAIRDERAVLLLVVDGPRLLGFAAVDVQTRALRELQVRGGAPGRVVLTLVLEAALTVAQRQPHASPTATAFAAA